MKKFLFIALATAALTSCSQDDTLDVIQGEEIKFGNAFIDNSTRATSASDPSYSTTSGIGTLLTEFNVYGAVEVVNIFAGYKVSKGDKGYGVAWTCKGAKQYWIAGASYKFVGVVDGNKSVDGKEVTKTTTGSDGLPATISYTVDGKTDLLCDVVTVESASASQGIVAFDYTHLLSKIKFSVKNKTAAEAKNYRIVLTDAKLTNVYGSGTYDVDADSWTPGTTTNFTLENLTIESDKTQYHSHEILLIPGSAVGVYVKANIEATDDDGENWKAVSSVEKTFSAALGQENGSNKTLQKATAYNFIVELGIGGEIQFTANQMAEWGNGGTTTLTQQ